jgi:putative hemolysin
MPAEVTFSMGPLSLALQILLLVVSLVAVAFFSSSEASLISVNKLRIRHQAEQGNEAARAVRRVVGQHERFFATILLTENAFIIFATSLGTSLAIALLGGSATSVAIATAFMTVVIVTFGEITPKALAAQASERWAMVVARPIEFVMKLETFLIYLFTLLPRGLGRLLRWKERLWTPSVTEGELRMLIDIGKTEGSFEESEADMLEKVFHFGDRAVRDVMTPRTQFVAVERHSTLKQLIDMYTQHNHSRFPVYEGTVDNIVGIVSLRDVVRAVNSGKLQPADSVSTLLRPAQFVPETKSVSHLFFELRAQGHPMAIVVDEYGGVAGVVTVNQLVEIIVGPASEDGRPLAAEYLKLSEENYRIDGGMPIEEANEKTKLGLPEGNYKTVAGFVLERLGRIPKEGDTFICGRLYVQVRRMNGVKVETVDIQRITPVENTK